MTSTTQEPLVSIVTPVYNGDQYLAECIESVCAQNYSNWEYIIVDNLSTDRTREIAEDYARRDPRIRVHTNETFLPLLQNWNQAMRQISADSKYCKVVHGDDWLFPDCVRDMVAVAEENSKVGIVGSYRLDEDRVNLDGLPYPSTIVPGKEIGRRYFLDGLYLFGSPTSLLFRSDLLRSRPHFYNERNLHADTEICFDLLRTMDFGFVHQVLTFTRRHNEAVTSTSRRLNTYVPAELLVLKSYGRDYLDQGEFDTLLRRSIKRYYRFLAKRFVLLAMQRAWQPLRELWGYHADALKELGHPLSRAHLGAAILIVLYNGVLAKLTVA